MITSLRVCVACNEFWPWPIPSRSFSYDFAIKLLKYGTHCHVRFTTCRVMEGFFPYLVQTISGIRGRVAYYDNRFWLISSWSFSHECAIKLLKCGLSFCVCSTACTVLGEFVQYLANIFTSFGLGDGGWSICQKSSSHGSFKFLQSGGGIRVDHWSTISSFNLSISLSIYICL